jgi:hypothetical protein
LDEESVAKGERREKFLRDHRGSYTFGWRTFDQACLDAFEQGFLGVAACRLHEQPITRT